MAHWFDKAAEEIEQQHSNDEITDSEYRQAMRELQQEWNESEEDCKEGRFIF